MADDDISSRVPQWQRQWMDRTLPALYCETVGVVYVLAFVSLFVGLRALLRVRRSRRELEANPSNRTTILADCDKRMRSSTRTIFYIANMYLIHALGIWLFDATIGVNAIVNDVTANPQQYSTQFWMELALESISMLAVFTAIFIIFPLVQVMVVASLVRRTVRKNGDGTLAAWISEGRIVTSHLAQFWTMAGFFTVAWWPVFSNTTMRLCVLEAVCGSGLTWLHASYAFNFRSESLSKVQLWEPVGICDRVKLYGKQVYAVHEKTELLPKYEVTEVQAPEQKTES